MNILWIILRKCLEKNLKLITIQSIRQYIYIIREKKAGMGSQIILKY